MGLIYEHWVTIELHSWRLKGGCEPWHISDGFYRDMGKAIDKIAYLFLSQREDLSSMMTKSFNSYETKLAIMNEVMAATKDDKINISAAREMDGRGQNQTSERSRQRTRGESI